MTHHESDDEPTSSDADLEALLGSLGNADFERFDPPADLYDAIRTGIGATDSDDMVPGLPVVISMTEPRRSRRRSRSALLGVAAAAVIAVVSTVGIVVRRDDPAPQYRELASATLDQVEPLGATTATARLLDENGRTHLVIDATAMAAAPPGSAYELWLIDPALTDPRSLGAITGTQDVVVPDSIDTTDHSVVDISLEPVDGDRSHSGHSLMRGTLGE